MAHRYGLYSMRRHEYGGAVLFDAYKWRTILRIGSSGAPRIRATRSLYVSQDNKFPQDLMAKYRVDWLVKLAGTGHWRTLRRLPSGGDDPCLRFHYPSKLCSAKLARLAAHDTGVAHTWMYQ